jgi:hypothetical protein
LLQTRAGAGSSQYRRDLIAHAPAPSLCYPVRMLAPSSPPPLARSRWECTAHPRPLSCQYQAFSVPYCACSILSPAPHVWSFGSFLLECSTHARPVSFQHPAFNVLYYACSLLTPVHPSRPPAEYIAHAQLLSRQNPAAVSHTAHARSSVLAPPFAPRPLQRAYTAHAQSCAALISSHQRAPQP